LLLQPNQKNWLFI